MSNETKRDVFEAVWNRLAGYQVFFNGWPRETLNGYKKRYDSALPDDMPVIQKVWGDTIEEFKANHYRLSEIFTEWDWNYDEQELIARAWVLGVWCVEGTGEIVKLEAKD